MDALVDILQIISKEKYAKQHKQASVGSDLSCDHISERLKP